MIIQSSSSSGAVLKRVAKILSVSKWGDMMTSANISKAVLMFLPANDSKRYLVFFRGLNNEL